MRRKNLSFVAGICILIGLVSTGLLMSIHGSVTPIPQEISPNLPVVALTFDDGPNARFTPEILDILYEQQVPATFFVVGDHLFGTTQFLGIDFGFWVAMGLVVLIVAAMNLIFWLQKPVQ